MDSPPIPQQPVAIITGAARGFGKALAIHFAQNGYQTVLIDRDKAALDDMPTDNVLIKSPVDICDASAVNGVIQEVMNSAGRIDVLVNNAGIGISGGIAIDQGDFTRQLDVNVTGAFNCLQAVSPVLKQQRSGYIFNISSMAAKFCKANRLGLAVSKKALLALNESVFREMAEYHVKVTALVPHYFGELRAPAGGTAPIRSDQTIPLDDLIRTVSFLLSLSGNSCVQEVEINCQAVIARQNT